jgi:probable rRNA maturation factor
VVRNLRIYNNQLISKSTIHKLINLLKKELEFTIDSLEVSFVNSAEIIRLNKKYLEHKHSTDIITFDYSKSISSLEGEILISLDDALDNSKKFKASFKEELIRLLIHGVLHLLGYKDKKVYEREVMKTKENLLYRRFKYLADQN